MSPNEEPDHDLIPFVGRGGLRDPNAELIALWCLRILVGLGGQKELLGSLGFGNDHLADAIGLGHLSDEQVDPLAARKILRRRLGEVEATAPSLVGPLAENLAYAAEVLDLSETDRLVLAFAALIGSHAGLDDTGDTLGHKLTDEQLARVLAVTLGAPFEEVIRSLSPRGAAGGPGRRAACQDGVEWQAPGLRRCPVGGSA